MIVIRYADDTIVGFQHEHEARAFLDELKERMREFELALHRNKTRLIRFGRYAAKQRQERGEGKPETFDFSRLHALLHAITQMGLLRHRTQDDQEADASQLQAIKMELRKRMHDPITKTGAWVEQMLKGHLNYFAVSGNTRACGGSSPKFAGAGLRRSNGEASGRSFIGRVHHLTTASSRQSGYCTLSRCIASTPEPEGGARCVSSARRDLCGGEEQSSSLPRP